MDPLFGSRELSVSQYIATILTMIRRDFCNNLDDFHAIVRNGTLVREISDNWDYYHMYDYKDTIRELRKFEPLIQA